MARKSVKKEQLTAQRMPATFEAAEQNYIEQPISSGDTIAIESDATMTDGGLQVLGRGVRKLVQAIQELRHLGVEDLVLPLPKICVVGDQSAGKSSLIEGISEIKVPRGVSYPFLPIIPIFINFWGPETFLTH